MKTKVNKLKIAMVVALSFAQGVVAEGVATPIIATTESTLQAPVVDMFNTIQGLNVVIDNVFDGTVNKYYFDGVDVTVLVQDMVNSGLVEVLREDTRTILIVPSEQPFLGEHEFGIELFDGVVISKKSILELPPQSQRSTRASVTSMPTLGNPADNAPNVLLRNLAFSWNAVPTATNYRIVISETNNFSGFTEANGASTCNNTCFTTATTGTNVTRTQLADYWWKVRTYYWHVRANGPNGVSAWSNTRTFTTGTQIRRDIVTAALNFSNNSASPRSVTGTPWLTDVAGGDGSRIRNAIVFFRNWVETAIRDGGGGGYATWSVQRPVAPQATRTLMSNALSANGGLYDATRRTMLIERIRLTFAGIVPADDNATLALLGIRAQCKEFADRMVELGRGTKRAYRTGAVPNVDISPGMYAFINDSSHAAIIIAVKWGANGNVTSLRLAESNWGVGWQNPTGQVPWERTITNAREVSETGYSEVSAE